ncbi:glycoside hydrolase family 5 protein [Deinococcus sp.]|uniref:glycoside hydrolase family 5 protein n=1 Tax=Deinococcus sp. TaxID=47478 RepID=UPI003CC502D9
MKGRSPQGRQGRWLAALSLAVGLGLAGREAGSQTLPAAPAPTFSAHRGVNLEGWLDAPQFSGFDDAKLRQLPLIRAAGFDFVRLLVNPAPIIGARGDEPAATLGRILKAARQNDLRVLVSFYDPEDAHKAAVLQGGQALDTYLVFLERTARALRESDPHWVAAEPIDQVADCAVSAATWMQLQTKFVEALRRGHPGLSVLLPSPCYSNYYSLTLLHPLSDPNLIYSFQYVEPLLFTQQGNPENADWQSFRNVPYPYDKAKLQPVLKAILAGVSDAGQRAKSKATFEALSKDDFTQTTLRGQLALVGGWAKQNGVRVLLTSFAVRGSAPAPDRARWFFDVRQAAEAGGMAWAAWSWTSPYGFGLSRDGKLPPDLKRSLGLP